MSDWLDICELDRILPNSGVCALVDNKQVAIFRFGEGQDLYAIDNYDPFSKANVLSRGLVGDVKAQPVVASPIYKQHFNLQTGRCLEDESVQINTYRLKVEKNTVKIHL